MHMNLMKRMMSLLLALALLMGNIPAVAFAEETEIPAETEMVAAEETLAPTEAATEPAETVIPTEVVTEPTVEETVAPTQPAVPEETAAPTEPVVEETVVPTESVEETIPIETAAPTEAVTEPIEETVPATESIEETEAVPETQPMWEVEHFEIPFTVNPLYEGIFTESDFPARAEPASNSDEESDHSDMDYWQDQELLNAPTYLSIEKATERLKQYLLKRDTSFTLYFKADSTKYEKYLSNMLLDAFKHTGKPKEGDYLQWHFVGWGGTIDYFWEDGTCHFVFDAEVYYLTTETQEEKLDTAVTNLLKSLNVSDKSNYKKIKAVYDYICQNVTYDYDHLEDDSYVLKHSAYAALVKKTAVCQGYATLLYRILLELDVDVRVIAGLAEDGSGHAWNIVKIGDVYYNLDATWDAGYDEYYYFLRNTINFPYHYRYMEYATMQFHTDYPMAQEDYVEGEPGVMDQYFVIGVCGDEVAFAIDRERNLVIAGNGPMWDFASTTSGNEADYPPWYYWMDAFDHVIIEEGVTTVAKNAFGRMQHIVSVSLPGTLKLIGEYAFYGCSKIATVNLSETLESLEHYAFYGCTSLKEIGMPTNLKKVGSYAFYGCSALTDVRLSAVLERIDSYAFYGCTEITDIDLPKTLRHIGSYAFYNCKALTAVSIPEGVTEIEEQTFRNCYALKKVDIPNSVTEIGSAAFMNCTVLEDVTLPDNLVSLGSHAFEYCNITNVTIPKGVTEIVAGAFGHCAAMTSLTLHNGITDIGKEAFYGCTSLQELILPDNLTSIGTSAFNYCKSLTSVEIPSNITSLGENVFANCNNLEKAVIGEGITNIKGTFTNCSKLCEVSLPSMLTSIGDYTFQGCSSLKTIDIPEGVTSITDYAFWMSGITDVNLPDSLQSIGNSAFADCDNLTQITISANVTELGYHAMGYCDNLSKVYFEGNAPKFDNMAFANTTATAYYPFGNATWTENIMRNYGGTITWCVLCPDHEYSSVDVIAPSCVANGYTSHTCPVCGDSYHTDETEKLGHDISNWEIAAHENCTTDGSKVRICQREGCGHSETEVIPALGHDMGAWIIDKKETCDEDGQQHSACSRCDHIETEAISAFGHSYESVVTPPTYTKDGYTTYTCSVCGATYMDDHVDALGLPKSVVKAAGNPVTGGGTLTWEHDGEADYYKVYRATSKSGKYKLLETVEGTELEVKVSVGKTYYYKVKAICDADASLNSGYSSVVKVTGKCAQPEIDAAVKPSSGKPVVKWSKVSGAKKYDVYRATEIDGTYKKVKTTTSTSYTDSKATLGTTYYYKVKAIASKSTYNSGFSEVDSCLTILAQPDAELSINKTTGKPVIEWEKVSGAIGYEILRAESEEGEYAKLEEYQGGLSFEDSTTEPDKDYWYKVNAIAENPALNSIDGDAEMVHATLAKPVVSFGVNSITGKPVMTWEEVDGAVEYKIYRSSKSKESYKCIETTTDLSYSDDSVKAGKGYYYKVIAIGENCKSAYSSYKKLTAKCARPEITVEASTTGKPVIKWSKISGAKKYEVYRATEENGTYKKVKTTTSTSYTDSKATLGTTYYYKVKAIASKSTYNSIESEVESCLTVLARPVVTAKNDADTGKVILSWEKVDGAVAYEVYRMGEDGILCPMRTQWERTYTDEGEGTEVDTVYTYTVKAIAENSDLNSAESTAVTISAACEKPSISIVLDGKKPMVSWDSVEGATKYYVYRSTKKSSGYKKVATVELEDGTSYRDSKAKKGTTYYYKIVAVSENTKSTYSNVVKIKSK